MNLAHARRVLGANRVFVLCGVVLSILAALFVYGSPTWNGTPSIKARAPEVWRASSVLFLTQKGFPAGRAVINPAVASADPSRFSSLAVLYAELAASDRVRSLAGISREDGDIVAEPVIYDIGQYSSPYVLPMVRISVTAATAADAFQGTRSVSRALQRYVTSGQSSAKIRPSERVLIQTARSGSDEAVLVSGPSKVVPMVIFALLVGLFLMAVFGYDNYRAHARESDVADGLRPVEQVNAASTSERAADRPTRLQPTGQPLEGTHDRVRKATPQRPRAVLPAERPVRSDTDGAAASSVREPS